MAGLKLCSVGEWVYRKSLVHEGDPDPTAKQRNLTQVHFPFSVSE